MRVPSHIQVLRPSCPFVIALALLGAFPAAGCTVVGADDAELELTAAVAGCVPSWQIPLPSGRWGTKLNLTATPAAAGADLRAVTLPMAADLGMGLDVASDASWCYLPAARQVVIADDGAMTPGQSVDITYSPAVWGQWTVSVPGCGHGTFWIRPDGSSLISTKLCNVELDREYLTNEGVTPIWRADGYTSRNYYAGSFTVRFAADGRTLIGDIRSGTSAGTMCGWRNGAGKPPGC